MLRLDNCDYKTTSFYMITTHNMFTTTWCVVLFIDCNSKDKAIIQSYFIQSM